MSTGTRIWTDSVIHPWSSSRGGAIQVPQLQFILKICIFYNKSERNIYE